VGVFLDAMVRCLEALQKPATRVPYSAIRVGLFDGLNRDAAGFLAAFVSAHAIRHNGQPALDWELQIVGRLPIGIAVFVVFALAADIAQARQLHTGPNFHSTPFTTTAITLAEFGLYRTSCKWIPLVGPGLVIRTNQQRPQSAIVNFTHPVLQCVRATPI